MTAEPPHDASAMLNLHSVLPHSRANGPGVRFVIWFQGYTRNCPGCFNPETHTHASRVGYSVDALCERIRAESPTLEGVTISGGEPFEQQQGLLDLVRALRSSSELSILVFSGDTLAEIRKMPVGEAILAHIDVLIAGPYNRSQHKGNALLGSANQRVYLLTEHYTEADIARVPATEAILSADGTITSPGSRRSVCKEIEERRKHTLFLTAKR